MTLQPKFLGQFMGVNKLDIKVGKALFLQVTHVDQDGGNEVEAAINIGDVIMVYQCGKERVSVVLRNGYRMVIRGTVSEFCETINSLYGG
jgi:hypothetical protein